MGSVFSLFILVILSAFSQETEQAVNSKIRQCGLKFSQYQYAVKTRTFGTELMGQVLAACEESCRAIEAFRAAHRERQYNFPDNSCSINENYMQTRHKDVYKYYKGSYTGEPGGRMVPVNYAPSSVSSHPGQDERVSEEMKQEIEFIKTLESNMKACETFHELRIARPAYFAPLKKITSNESLSSNHLLLEIKDFYNKCDMACSDFTFYKTGEKNQRPYTGTDDYGWNPCLELYWIIENICTTNLLTEQIMIRASGTIRI